MKQLGMQVRIECHVRDTCMHIEIIESRTLPGTLLAPRLFRAYMYSLQACFTSVQVDKFRSATASESVTRRLMNIGACKTYYNV